MNRHSVANIGRIGLVVMREDDSTTMFLGRHLEWCGLQAFTHPAYRGVLYYLRRRARFGRHFAVMFVDAACIQNHADEILLIQQEFPNTQLVMLGTEEELRRAGEVGIAHTIQTPLLSTHRETRVHELLNKLFPGD